MEEVYWAAMGKRLLFWSGWVFTVCGAIVGLYLSKEYTWVGTLVVLTALIAFGTHSRWVHHRLKEAEQRYQTELGQARQQHREEVTRREQAEQRLAEVPADALTRLAALVSEGMIHELVGLLRRQADIVGRLQQYNRELTKPLVVRSFQRLQGELYVVARGPSVAIRHLRPGDPFVLHRKSDTGVQIDAARMVVHQPVQPDGDVVQFRVVGAISDDMTHLAGLAVERLVEGIKGYGVEIALDLTGLPALNFAQVAEAIPHLASIVSAARGS